MLGTLPRPRLDSALHRHGWRKSWTMKLKYAAAAIILVLGFAAPVAADTVNSFRQAHGRPSLHSSHTMQALAQHCANSMAARNSLDHAGFLTERGPAGARAENVAMGCATESCTIDMWKRSAGHRANMLRRDVVSYGLASANGGKRRYWCLNLGG